MRRTALKFTPLRLLDLVSDIALGVTVVVTSSAILMNVVLRFVFNDPIGWVDEFATLLFIWMTIIGTAVVLRDDSHMAVLVFVDLAPRPIQILLFALKNGLVLMSLGVLSYFGLELFTRMSFVEFPAMGISRGFLYAVLPVLAPLMIVNVLRSIVRYVRTGDSRPSQKTLEGSRPSGSHMSEG